VDIKLYDMPFKKPGIMQIAGEESFTWEATRIQKYFAFLMSTFLKPSQR